MSAVAHWITAGGVLVMAVAGGSYIFLNRHVTTPKIEVSCPAPAAPVINVPAPVVNVTAPVAEKPYVCTPRQAEAGECLPLLKKDDAEVAAPVPLPRPRPKPKATPVKKLKAKWVAPEAKPFNFKDLFNVR